MTNKGEIRIVSAKLENANLAATDKADIRNLCFCLRTQGDRINLYSYVSLGFKLQCDALQQKLRMLYCLTATRQAESSIEISICPTAEVFGTRWQTTSKPSNIVESDDIHYNSFPQLSPGRRLYLPARTGVVLRRLFNIPTWRLLYCSVLCRRSFRTTLLCLADLYPSLHPVASIPQEVFLMGVFAVR